MPNMSNKFNANTNSESDSVFVRKLQNRQLSEMTPSDTNSNSRRSARENVEHFISEKNYIDSYINTQSDAIPKNYMNANNSANYADSYDRTDSYNRIDSYNRANSYNKNNSYNHTNVNNNMHSYDNMAVRKQYGGRKQYDSSVESSQYSDMNTESVDSDIRRSRKYENSSSYEEDDITGSTKNKRQMSRNIYTEDYSDEQSDEYDEKPNRSMSREKSIVKRELPDAIKKRQELRTFLKENGITGGLEISPLIEKYLDESGFDKKENLDKAIDAAKKKMLKDQSNGTIDKLLQKFKTDIKNKREAKKKNK